MLDQRLAMQWVHNNVEAFGGDNKRIAIVGISAGSESASAHVISPGSAGLFKRAILQSGPFTHRIDTLAERQAQGAIFASRVGCTTGDILACMRSKTRDEVLNALALDAGGWTEAGGVRWSPVVDGLELPDQPRTLYEVGVFNNVRVIVGSARDDGFAGVNRSFPSSITETQYVAALNTEFGPYAADVLAQYPSYLYASPKEALSAVASDFGYICEARRIARLTARPGIDTDGPDDLASDAEDKSAYLYSFERITTDLLHVLHGTDHPFLFGNLYALTGFDPNLDPNDIALFQSMAGYWARFAEKGKPNHGNDGAVNWPAYGAGDDPDRNLVLNVPITVNSGYRAAGAPSGTVSSSVIRSRRCQPRLHKQSVPARSRSSHRSRGHRLTCARGCAQTLEPVESRIAIVNGSVDERKRARLHGPALRDLLHPLP